MSKQKNKLTDVLSVKTILLFLITAVCVVFSFSQIIIFGNSEDNNSNSINAGVFVDSHVLLTDEVVLFYKENNVNTFYINSEDISSGIVSSNFVKSHGGKSYIVISKDISEEDIEQIKKSSAYGVVFNLENNITELTKLKEKINLFKNSEKEVGIIVSKDVFSEGDNIDPLEGEDIDFVIPKIDVGVKRIEGIKDFTYYVDEISLYAKKNKVDIRPTTTFFNVFSEGNSGNIDIYEISSQFFYIKNNKYIKNLVMDFCLTTKSDFEIFNEKLSLWLLDNKRDFPLVQSGFEITRPENNFSTKSATYNIFGISNPDKDLLFFDSNTNEKWAVTYRGDNGSFSYLVNLEVGTNTFTFTQENETKTITITREKVVATGDETTEVITKSSMVPSLETFVRAGEGFLFKCVAPSTSFVVATIGEIESPLKQNAVTEKSGIPANYSGEAIIPAGIVGDDEIVNLGKITYTLSFNGKITEYQSSGDVIVVGKNVDVCGMSKKNLTNLYASLDDVSSYKYSSEMKFSAFSKIEKIEGAYYLLESGDYVKRSDVMIVDGRNYSSGILKDISIIPSSFSQSIVLEGIENCVSNVVIETSIAKSLEQEKTEIANSLGEDKKTFSNLKENYENFSNKSSLGVESPNEAAVQVDHEKIIFTIYNVDSTGFDFFSTNEKINEGIKNSEVFINGKIYAKEKNIIIKLTAKPNMVDGYNVENLSNVSIEGVGEKKNTVVYIKSKSDSEGFNPLKNKTIILDAGHGGSDSGAIGIAGDLGPYEKDLTLSIALETKKILEENGANVLMIRQDDMFAELHERADINERMKPDMFVSIHINSVDESVSSEGNGVEVYYYREFSKELAKNISEKVSLLPRKNRGEKEGSYVVARPSVAPSVLCEIGFASNPYEYDELVNTEKISETAKLIASGIENALVR